MFQLLLNPIVDISLKQVITKALYALLMVETGILSLSYYIDTFLVDFLLNEIVNAIKSKGKEWNVFVGNCLMLQVMISVLSGDAKLKKIFLTFGQYISELAQTLVMKINNDFMTIAA